MRHPCRPFVVTLALSVVLSSACSEDDPITVRPDTGVTGAKEGEACLRTADCAPQLFCAGTATCQRAGQPGTQARGEVCASNNDCQIEFVCASNRECVDPGSGIEGSGCQGNEDCTRDFLCSSSLTCARPGSPGTSIVGESCTEVSDCALGLLCLEKTCNTIQLWAGATCPDPAADAGAFRALFQLPGTGAVSGFYRLPFPNDFRRKDGRVDVSGHANPAIDLPAEFGDVVGALLSRISADVTGWSLHPTVFLRLSQAADLDKNPSSLTVQGENATIQAFNIDTDSADYGRALGLQMWASTSRGKYICHNWIAVRPEGLEPSTTYAVLLRKGIKDTTGTEAVQDQDFQMVIGDSAPTDAVELAAWQAYAPLRAYIADRGIDPSTVISAAVFTTMDPRAKLQRLRAAVHAQPAPTANELTLCDGAPATKSPCDNGTDHICPAQVDAAFDEIQGIYQTPVFQQGTPPYKLRGDGTQGLIAYNAGGQPIHQRDEDVCFALTLPKGGAMPASGWPVVIFLHGTGGHYRSFIENGTASALARVSADQQTVARMAVISIDGSMHGPRSNSTEDPAGLFFNLRNPGAARDNVYQGAADKFQLMRLVQSLDLASQDSPTGRSLKLDPDRVYLFAHSQGTIEGTPFAAYEPEIQAVLLSGAGGLLLDSLLHKTKPVDIVAGIKFVLVDQEVDILHPMLNLFQLYLEEVDTISYGSALTFDPPLAGAPRHLFLSYGVADGYTPPSTIRNLAREMGLPQLDQRAQRCGDGVCNGTEHCQTCSADCPAQNCGPHPPGFDMVSAPLRDNLSVDDTQITAALVPYSSEGSFDDHFVIFQTTAGRAQSAHFFGSAARDGAPTIPAQ